MSAPKIKRRGRIVSFRVSEEEYLNLCRATESAGADSISEFARHVACNHSLIFSTSNVSASSNGLVNGKITEVQVAPALLIEVTQLHKRVDELGQQVQTLTRRVNRGI